MNERVEGNSIPFCQGPNPDPGTPIHSTPSEAWDLPRAHLRAGRTPQRGPSRQALHARACCFEPLFDLACNGYAARRVGVNADGVRFHR